MRQIRLVLWLVVAMIVVVGCDGSEQPSEASGQLSEATDDGQQFTPGPLPASAMWAEYTDLMGIFDGMVEDLVVECMAREGFQYRPLPIESWTGWGEVVSARPIRALSVEEASENGYLRTGDVTDESFDFFDGPEEQRDAFYQALSGDEWVAHDSGMTVGVGGCLGESRAAVAGDVDKMVEWLGTSGALQNLTGAAYNIAEVTDEWETALGHWQQCLAEQDYDVVEQDDLLAMALEGAEDLTPGPIHEQDDEPIEGEPRPTELEKELATLDATCQQQSGIVAEWDRLLSLAEQEVVADNPEVVIGWSETSQEIRAAVADVLEAIPDPGTDPATEYTTPPPQD